MHGSRRQRLIATAAVAATAVVAIAVAFVVVALTRPSDQEIQEEVAVRLGVPEGVLEIPLVQRVLEETSAEARTTVFDQLEQSLLLGGIAGLFAAVGASMLVTRPWRAPADEPPGEHTPGPTFE